MVRVTAASKALIIDGTLGSIPGTSKVFFKSGLFPASFNLFSSFQYS